MIFSEGLALAGVAVAVFVFFALGLVGVELLDKVTWGECAYAMLSLFVVRPLAVALALIGTRLRRPTVAFAGWFGPRGLASVVAALIVLVEDHELPGIDTITVTALVTALLSIVLHGLSTGARGSGRQDPKPRGGVDHARSPLRCRRCSRHASPR